MAWLICIGLAATILCTCHGFAAGLVAGVLVVVGAVAACGRSDG